MGSPGTRARLDALARPDKWFLSAGEGILWAPPLPDHLDRPGFWDEAHVFHFPVRPLFTMALVDARGREVPLRPLGRSWRPDRLVARWEAGPGGPVLVEERTVLTGARFGSVWTVEPPGRWDAGALAERWLAAFTQLPARSCRVDGAIGGGVAWRRRVVHRNDLEAELGFDLVAAFVPPSPGAGPPEPGRAGGGGEGTADAGAEGRPPGGQPRVERRAVVSQGRETPRWDLSPFPELWRDGLGDGPAVRGPGEGGLVHVAVALPVADPGSAPDRAVSFTLRVRTPGFLAGGNGRPDPSGGTASPSPRPAAPGSGTSGWLAALEAWPRFSCSDPWLTRYWDYRIYGLHLNRLAPGPRGYPHPAVAEGIEYFHWPISYSAQCHMLETRWTADPRVARGSLLNFLAAQREDGSLPGRLHLCPDAAPEPDFYHANWGDAALAVDAVHPDGTFLAEAYAGLARYARWLTTARDPGGSGMVTVTNHYETGQEYMSRYVAVDRDADRTEWEPRLDLRGIDATVYLHRLQRALATMAVRAGREGEAARWTEEAASSAAAILGTMWDDDSGLFSDVDGATGRRTGVKAAVCFYPLLTDLLDARHVEALLGHLTDPDEFWTPWPVPSSSADDPLFDARGLWKGVRRNCPWNGRVWPMTNSHVVEGLLRQWRAGRRSAGPVAAGLLRRFVRMMFDDGDPDRPNAFEHYNPYTAHPSRFRGIDDYQHSWVLDLLARGVAGLDPDGWLTPAADPSRGLRGAPGASSGDGPGAAAPPDARPLVVDPLPLGLEEVDLEGAVVRGRRVDVRIRGDAVTATVDGVEHRGAVGEPLLIGAEGP